MSSPTKLYPSLPTTPRPSRQLLSPLNTNVHYSSTTTPTSSASSEKTIPSAFIDTRTRNAESRIFVNATIPLSPVSSTMQYSPQTGYEGLAPRKKNGFARLFCCLGREERARRKAERYTEYEKVGDFGGHWSEY